MAKMAKRSVPMEVSWAQEKMALAADAVSNGDWGSAAAALDIARLHLEVAAIGSGQGLHPRTEAAQAMEQKHADVRGVI